MGQLFVLYELVHVESLQKCLAHADNKFKLLLFSSIKYVPTANKLLRVLGDEKVCNTSFWPTRN